MSEHPEDAKLRKRIEGNTDFDRLTPENAAHQEELEEALTVMVKQAKVIMRYQDRLEISDEHDIDGIDARDETIRLVEEQNTELAAYLEELREAFIKAQGEMDEEPDSIHLCDRVFNIISAAIEQSPTTSLADVKAKEREKVLRLLYSTGTLSGDGTTAEAIRNMGMSDDGVV